MIFKCSMYAVKSVMAALVMAGGLMPGLNVAHAQGQAEEELPFPPAPNGDEYRAAVNKSLPLLQSSAKTFAERAGATCFSCHHQMLAAWTFSVARQHGINVEAKLFQENKTQTEKFIAPARKVFIRAASEPEVHRKLERVFRDTPTTLGYLSQTLHIQQFAPDEFTAALAIFLMRLQQSDGRWTEEFARPPFEGSEFTSTALAIRSLQLYMPKDRARESAASIAKAQAWLATAKPKTLEDRAFRLLELGWARASQKTIRQAVADLLDQRNDDNGWGQLPGAESDAYATGLALVALYEGGGMPASDPGYRRGVNYLMLSQKQDGSWLVRKRAIPVVPMFESGYPHGNDQYISYVGACWATMALAYAVPVPSAAPTTVATGKEASASAH